MSQIQRMVLSVEGAVTMGFVAVMWLWSNPYLSGIVEQYPGPFTSNWELIQVIVPVTIGTYYVIFIGYVLWGPVEQERARQTARGRR
jgi:hypothetical protein